MEGLLSTGPTPFSLFTELSNFLDLKRTGNLIKYFKLNFSLFQELVFLIRNKSLN